ncbi:Golgin subfamily B member 1 [Labeo rohita]|uniref:Golgin subfamily B member 1 n=1 Tax=Labeo rohita TaxID=84645 RepID=A0A498NIP7_LABRO|nr:Golgin subfamily B member 1 [Labeo rohita]
MASQCPVKSYMRHDFRRDSSKKKNKEKQNQKNKSKKHKNKKKGKKIEFDKIKRGEPLSADKWMMSIEGTIVMGPHNNLLNGVAATFSAYYVFNLQYPKEASSTLEFVQRAFCGINSQTGSKAEKRHKLNAPVCTLLRKLLDFELMG